MKHKSTIFANGLCTPPCGSSHGKFSSFRFSSLLILLLLMLGSVNVWGADATINAFVNSSTIYFDCSAVPAWDDNASTIIGALFYNQSNPDQCYNKSNSTNYVNMGGTGSGEGSFQYNGGDTRATKVSTHLWKVTVPSGNLGAIRFLRVSWGDANWCWAESIILNVDNAQGHQNVVKLKSGGTDGSLCDAEWSTLSISDTYHLRGDLWSDASGNWKNTTSSTLPQAYKESNDAYTFSFVAPGGMRNRFAVQDKNGSSGDGYTASKADGSSSDVSTSLEKYSFTQSDTKRVDITFYPNNGNNVKVTLSNYRRITTGWYFKCESAIGGIAANTKTALAADGTLLLSNVAAGTYYFYICNNDNTLWWGVNQFGGSYVDLTNSTASLVSEKISDTKFSTSLPIKSLDSRKVRLTVSAGDAGKDIRVSFDGGKIVLTAVEPSVPATTYTVTLHPKNGGESTIVKENVPEGSTSSSAALNLSSITYGQGNATWYTNPECTAPFSTVTGNMDLYAKWGVSGNYYVAGSLWLQDNQTSGDWYNERAKLMTYPNNASSGTASFTYIGHRGKNVIEIIKDKDWGKSQRDLDSNSPVSLSIENNHIVFTLSEAKQVTVSYNGKVSVSTSDVSLGDYTIWRIKTNGWGGQAEWAHSLKLESDGTHIFRDVPAGGNKQFTVTKGSDDMENVGINVFHALYINTTIPTQPSALTWTMQTAKLDANAITIQAPQSDNFWRNGVFSLSEQSDLKLTFDGGNISIDVLPKYTVSFNSNGGSEVASQTMFEGRTASEPVDPTKDGYEFDSWRIGSVEGDKYDFESPVTANITLVAKWNQVIKHTVTFNSNDGSAVDSQEVADGEAASKPADPTKGGYVFSKWQLNGVDYNFSSPVTTDITLDAVWTAKTLESISLDESSIVMVMGGSNATLTPSFLPADLIAEKRPTYDWSVSEGGVVTVDGGVITAVGEGTVTVTCTAHGTDKSANCVVTVKDCNTEPTDIFAYTLGSDPTGIAAGSAVMNGMFNEASNTVEPTLQQVNIQLSAETNDHKWIYDNGDETRNVKIDNETDDNKVNDAFKWYVIEVSEGVMALQNVNTKHYLAMSDEVEDNGNVWGRKFATTIESYITNVGLNNDALWKWGSCDENSPRLKVMSTAQNNANYTTGEYTLHCYGMSNNWRPDNTVMVGSQDGCQGNKHLRPFFKNAATVPNPAYLKSPDAGYYRFATGANVVVTLNRAIKVNDVIRLEVKNPSEAAVSATVTIGSQVANINLAAGATSTETITVTDGSRPTSITIASDDVNFMLKSVAVNREMPNPAKNPNLAWSGTPSAAHQVADGDISSYIATRLGTGLITYTSSDESIATVAANGTVHPIAEGTVTITATLEQDGCYDGDEIHYDITLEDLPKPTITITANDEMPQGSYQTVTVSQNGNGALTFGITSGTGATLTNNGEGSYLLALAGNATDIVLTASTERTGQHAQHSVSKNISVQQCYVDGHVIYEYELSGHEDADGVAAEGGTYSQANLASVGTDDNPKTVELIKIKFQNDQNRIIVDDNGAVKYVTSTPEGDIEKWYKIPAGTNGYSNALYYLKNKGTDKYLYCDMASGYVGTQNGWNIYAPKMAAALPSATQSTGNTREAYKWFWYPHKGTENNNLHLTVNQGYQNSYNTRFVLHDKYDVAGNNLNSPYVRCGQGTDQGNSELRVVNEVVDANATNPDYFYSVENGNHTYYILNGGTATVSRASAFKVGDVITLNVFNRGEAASSTIKVAENTIADNVNGAAELTYTVVAEDGIEGLNNFVITPLNGYICLNSISIFRPKDESEFINPTLTWDEDLSEQQIINMNNSETGMTHAIASIDAPVNAAVVYSVSPAGKADIDPATGALTLTGEALNKDVLTVTATLPAIGCYNEAHATYEIYVKNLATPTLSAAFGTLQQGFASTLTVTTNSDAVPALSSISGFAVNGDPVHEDNTYIFNIVVGSIAETVSVHVALAVTSDYLAAEMNAAGNVTTSSLAQLYENTPAEGTLVLEADYNEGLVIDKAITIDGAGHSIGNLKVENEGDLTLSSALTVADFTICAKAGNTEIHAASGQVRNASNLTVGGNAYFLYTVDPSGHVQYGWYDFTVPFPVNVMTGIAGIENEVLNEDFVNERNYAIMEHLGDKQAAGEYSYKKFRGVMQPNKLYSITLDCSDNYNTIRFQKTNDGALVASESVTLDAHTGIDDNHSNWNGVGNGTLHHANAGVSVATIQVYQSGSNSFIPVDPSEISLAIGTAFMIQEAGSMTFSQANRDLLAPRRAASAQQATAVQIASEGKTFSDQLFIGADELAGQGYTQGVDVAKAGDLGSAKVAQIWANAYDSKLCAHEAQLNRGRAKYALSLYAPADGSYTLTGVNVPNDCTLYLTKNGKVIWNLGYTCDLNLTKGTTTEYGLLLVESPQMSTGVDAIQSDADGAKKIMRNGILYILHNGKVFNAQGAVMK